MKIQEVTISELKAATYNPRKLSDKQFENIKTSLEEFGFVDPIIVNKDNTIIGGHQRIKVWNELGNATVPVHYVDLAKDKEKELNIRLNNNTGEWDWNLLLSEFEHEDLIDWGFEDYEFPTEIEEDPDFDDDDDNVPNSAPPITVKGDIYELGPHRLICGDVNTVTDLEELMDGKQADLYLTDPPYNVDYEGKTKDALKIDNDKKDDADFLEFLEEAFTNVLTVLKDGGSYYIWHVDSEGYNFRAAAAIIGKVRQCLIWLKDTMVMGRQDYHWKHEPCLYGWKDGSAHYWNNDRKQTTILEFDRPKRSEEHPTMKPVPLFAYQIRNNSKKEEIVLDTFMGSGTTLIACEKTNRVSYGMEIDPKYCDVIVQRYVDHCNLNNVKPVIVRNGEVCTDFNGK